MIEQCHNSKNQSMIFLALDWAKAFDSIDPVCLVQALRRFGLPQTFLSIIQNIYTDRKFVVVDHGHKSDLHSQHFGISQGCPLSPFLFVMVMTVLLHDANFSLQNQHGIDLHEMCCNELVYADDTLLIEVDAHHLQKCMECVAEAGATYGLKLNWSKVEQLNVCCSDVCLYDPQGDAIRTKSAMKYLGAQLAADGHLEAEVAQKVGEATQVSKP